MDLHPYDTICHDTTCHDKVLETKGLKLMCNIKTHKISIAFETIVNKVQVLSYQDVH
jgi:hypothetical protein